MTITLPSAIPVNGIAYSRCILDRTENIVTFSAAFSGIKEMERAKF